MVQGGSGHCPAATRNRRLPARWSMAAWAILLALAALAAKQAVAAGPLEDLARPQEGRSMRATSTMRVGEVRRGGAEKKLDPKADPKGDLDEASNWDNFTVAPGETHVLMDEKGPGVITHIWITFLGPEPQDWAPKGAANHQEMLLRIYWDGNERPGGRGAGGRFLRQLLRQAQRGDQPAGDRRGRAIPTTASGRCRSASRPGSRSSTRARSRSACSTTTSTGSRRTSCPTTRRTSTPSTARNIRSQKGKDYVVLETTGQGPLRRHGAGGAHAQPGLVRRRRREDLHRRRGEAFDLGHRHRGLFPLGLGTEDDQHALLRRALFRPVGHRRRAHQRLPLARQRSARLQHGHQGHLRALRLDLARRKSRLQVDELERARGRLSPAWPSGIRRASRPSRPAPRTPASASLPSLERLTVQRGDFADAKHHGAGERRRPSNSSLYDGQQLLYTPEQAEDAWLEIPVRGEEEGAAAAAAEHDQELRFRQVPGVLNGVKLGGVIDLYSAKIVNEEVPPARLLARAGHLHAAAGMRRQEPAVAGLLLRHRVGAPARAAPARRAMGHDKDKDWRKQPLLYE